MLTGGSCMSRRARTWGSRSSGGPRLRRGPVRAPVAVTSFSGLALAAPGYLLGQLLLRSSRIAGLERLAVSRRAGLPACL